MTALITMIRTYWIIITFLLLAVITLLSLTPLPSIPAIPSNDKIQHFIAYSALTFPVVLRKPRYWLLIGLFFLCWSGGIELLQPYFHHRRDWLDMIANGAGIGCGILCALLLNRFFPARWKLKRDSK